MPSTRKKPGQGDEGAEPAVEMLPAYVRADGWINLLMRGAMWGADDQTCADYCRKSWDEVKEYFDDHPDVKLDFYHLRANAKIKALEFLLTGNTASGQNYYLNHVGYGDVLESALDVESLESDLA